MRRRDLITLLGGVAAAAHIASAQQPSVPVIGLLDAAIGPKPRSLDGIRTGLAETGFNDGQNVAIHYRIAEGDYDRLPALVADLIREWVALIIAPQLPSVLAAKIATATIPIVFMLGDDPVKHALVSSMNRPGGNATGLSMLTAGLDAKRVQILCDLAPAASRFGLLVNPENPNLETQVAETQEAGRVLGREIELLKAQNGEQVEAAFDRLPEHHIGALIIGADPFLSSRPSLLVSLAERYRVPAIYEWRTFVDVGGLASYGSSLEDNYRKLGVYAGKVLAGAKPSELPVLQPTKFEFVVNIRTAKALGLAVPPVLLAQADEVIE
jgi:ABC-type uncharacterized transport system substrate-binding protein